ncbi:hypothetical protein HMPREF1154_1106 [Capnocytophaga sp. CM59]|nr:hypothetical protein HMPREF1154_1106 [Capnocytophaga sp. CM59]
MKNAIQALTLHFSLFTFHWSFVIIFSYFCPHEVPLSFIKHIPMGAHGSALLRYA